MTISLKTNTLLGFRLLTRKGKAVEDTTAALGDKTGIKIPLEIPLEDGPIEPD